MNSALVHCSQEKSPQLRLKKKKSRNANANVNPNTHLLIKSFASVTVKINKFISFFLVYVML